MTHMDDDYGIDRGVLPDLMRGKSMNAENRLPLPFPEADQVFSFRPWEVSEAALCARFLNDRDLWRYMPETMPDQMDTATAQDLILLSRQAAHHAVRAVIHDERPIGQVRLQWDQETTPPRSAELSYWLGRGYQGKRLATPMIAAFLRRKFRIFPTLQHITARVHRDNLPSQKVLARLGFHPVEAATTDGPWLFVQRYRQP